MTTFVLGCSVTMSSVFPDEVSETTDRLRESLIEGQAFVPALWPVEGRETSGISSARIGNPDRHGAHPQYTRGEPENGIKRVFVYWDNANILHKAQRLAEVGEGTPGTGCLVHIHFENLLRLAEATRPLTQAVAAGSVPPGDAAAMEPDGKQLLAVVRI